VRIAIALLGVTLSVATSRADVISDLVEQLDDSSDRVRTAAVLALTRQESPRSIDGLIKTMEKTSESKNIRGLAANALGRVLLNGKPSAAQRKTAVDALTRAKGDREPYVAAKAEAALEALGGSGAGPAPTTPGNTGKNGIYVDVGPMSVAAANADKTKNRELMVATIRETFTRAASAMKLKWPTGRAPTKQELDAAGIAGFYVDGTLNELAVKKAGATAKISCKINMLVASFPDRNVFGMLNGGAVVEGSSTDKEVAMAQRDCVQAVIEDLIAKKIVPTIKSKVP
jgi:hypothetical protein